MQQGGECVCVDAGQVAMGGVDTICHEAFALLGTAIEPVDLVAVGGQQPRQAETDAAGDPYDEGLHVVTCFPAPGGSAEVEGRGGRRRRERGSRRRPAGGGVPAGRPGVVPGTCRLGGGGPVDEDAVERLALQGPDRAVSHDGGDRVALAGPPGQGRVGLQPGGVIEPLAQHHDVDAHTPAWPVAAVLVTSSMSASAAGPEEAGFCPVISRPSLRTYGAQSSPLE